MRTKYARFVEWCYRTVAAVGGDNERVQFVCIFVHLHEMANEFWAFFFF